IVLIGCGSSKESSGESSSDDTSGVSEEDSNEAADVDPVTLTYAASFSEGHYIPPIDKAMYERIEEETIGEVSFDTFYDATLVSPQDWYQELVQGTADVIEAPIGIEKDRFELEYATALFNYGITDLNL